MNIDDVFKKSREQRYIDARMMLFYYLNTVSGYNATEISRVAKIGPSSVANSINSFNDRTRYNSRLEKIWEYILVENSTKLDHISKDNLRAIEILDSLRDRRKVVTALEKFNIIITGMNGI
tara:strand:+ start:706 stop:1068 length:363 start_codon:yes stop_codon:yes gene_type:complete